jgi:hypothetical protein
MADEKQTKPTQDEMLPQVNIIEETTSKGMKYLDGVSLEMTNNPNYIPQHLTKALYPWIRNKRGLFDDYTEIMESSDKASDDYMEAARGREKVASDLVTAKSQLNMEKKVGGEFKAALGSMSMGTKEENIYTNMLVFGASGCC